MALVRKIKFESNLPGALHPTETLCKVRVFGEADQRVLQLSTVGSEEREHKGQTSQTIQFDHNAVQQLMQFLSKEFGNA
ncbi:MAG: hypothetical protein COB16_18540 [Rhodobacteraceae bacterium]|nr:MAG: hypothetical protein COB16_18540 [Paracoccaceae bacterium]